jgi:glycine/D-amino acid oxidase-like deaminating enzyme
MVARASQPVARDRARCDRPGPAAGTATAGALDGHRRRAGRPPPARWTWSHRVMTIADDLAGLAPSLGRRRAWWLREALAIEPGAPCPPLRGTARVDVAIVGGGFTGLWTAWHLLESAPGIRVAILERDIVGGGASGRNGGFVGGMWSALPGLVASFGADGALAIGRAAEGAPAAIAAWCAAHGVDGVGRAGGMLMVESSPAQAGAFEPLLALANELGVADRFDRTSADDVRVRSGSPRLGPGVLVAGDRTLQPALLARGLRRVLLERGVTIHERTPALRVGSGRPIRVETPNGALVADSVVLGLNAWAAAVRPFAARLVTWSSYIVLTEPIPERLAAIGYTGAEGITDARFTNHYWRVTADGRIAFGGGGGRAGRGGRPGRWAEDDLGSVGLAVRGLRRLYPDLADVALDDAWGGPIDIAPNHLPAFGTVRPGVHFGHGYSGAGVGPAQLGGRILAALALERADDPIARLPLVGAHPRPFPPEPFRWLGARVIREAIVAKEQRDDLGLGSPAILRSLVRLPRRMGYDLGPE